MARWMLHWKNFLPHVVEGDVEADNIEDCGDAIEAMLMLGVRSEIAANEETVEASAKYIFGDEDVRKSTMK